MIWYGKKTQAHSLQHFSKILLSHTSIYKTPGNYLFHQPRRVSAALKIEENNKRFIVAHIITCGYFSSHWNRETRYKMIVINRISSYFYPRLVDRKRLSKRGVWALRINKLFEIWLRSVKSFPTLPGQCRWKGQLFAPIGCHMVELHQSLVTLSWSGRNWIPSASSRYPIYCTLALRQINKICMYLISLKQLCKIATREELRPFEERVESRYPVWVFLPWKKNRTSLLLSFFILPRRLMDLGLWKHSGALLFDGRFWPLETCYAWLWFPPK